MVSGKVHPRTAAAVNFLTSVAAALSCAEHLRCGTRNPAIMSMSEIVTPAIVRLFADLANSEDNYSAVRQGHKLVSRWLDLLWIFAEAVAPEPMATHLHHNGAQALVLLAGMPSRGLASLAEKLKFLESRRDSEIDPSVISAMEDVRKEKAEALIRRLPADAYGGFDVNAAADEQAAASRRAFTCIPATQK